jgi:hypothetical protein
MDIKTMIIAGASGIFIIFMLTFFYFDISKNYNIYENNTGANFSYSNYEAKVEDFEAQAETFQDIFSNKTTLIEKGYLAVSGVFSSVSNIFSMTIGSVQLIFETITSLFPYTAVKFMLVFALSLIIIISIIVIWDWIRGARGS